MGIRTGFLGGVGERQWGGRKAISVLWLPIASEPSRDKAEIDYMVIHCRDITGRLTMQTSLGLPEDPIIW